MNERKFTPEEIAKSLIREVYGDIKEGVNLIASDMLREQDKRIRELEAELAKLREENRWIPAEERKPGMDDGPIIVMEDYTAVLVLVMIEGAITATTLYCDVDDGYFFDMQGDELIPYRVTHWKPMPKGSDA